jgi:hypothetical protein
MGARLPDYLELSIRVESFDIAGGFINIDNVTVRLRIDNIGSKETRNVYIQSGGVVHLVGIEHMASFTYGHHPALLLGSGDSKGKMGPVNLAIHASDTPLTLGAILTHFWPDTQIFPDYFSGVVNEVGLREFSLNTAYSESNKGQVVEMMRIGLGVTSTEIKILG